MTTSYTAGTVSVTAGSDMVTGSGTGWLTANIAPGYFGLDSADGSPVPVAEVISDTSMRLVTPWRGSSASGSAYWLSYDTRDGQQTVNNAQRLAEYIALLRNSFFSAIGGLTPTANTFLTFNAAGAAVLSSLTTMGRALLGVNGAADTVPYFTSASAAATTAFTAVGRSIVGAASQAAAYSALGEIPNPQIPTRIQSIPTPQSGTNALDLISETGWTTVTSANIATVNGPVNGGNGVCFTLRFDGAAAVQIFTNVSGAIAGADNQWIRRRTGGSWTPWVIVSSPILGSVSQGGGVQTGAIIERGSNANGEYVRFADGTQICWGASNPTTTGSANNYFGSTSGAAVFANDTISFPASFANNSYRLTLNPTFRGFVVLAGYSKTNSAATSRVGNPGTAMTEVPYDWMAIGRWF